MVRLKHLMYRLSSTRAVGRLASRPCLPRLASPALAQPVLRSVVEVTGGVVTIGDMFDDAGPLAGQAIFLAPALGTTGSVAVADIRAAAVRTGLPDFDVHGLASVEVSRDAVTVDSPMLSGLLGAELGRRGLLDGGATAQAAFDALPGNLLAARDAEPAKLASLQYAPDSGLFSGALYPGWTTAAA